MAFGGAGIRRRSRDVDMTEGSIVRHLLLFALPLLAGNMFQQLYNMVDTWVVGNYVSNEAFSAVGSVGPLINTLIGIFSGFSIGMGAVISQFYGAKQYDKVKEAVHTSIVLTIIMSIAIMVLGFSILTPALRMMKIPDEIMPLATAYLRIYFIGIPGLVLYNLGAGILRAVGDSKRPFYFLVVAAVVNTMLDLVFVLCFRMGVEGVAWATIIAQAVSAVLVILSLLHSDSCIKLSLRELKINKDLMFKILKVGFPAALQMALTSFSNAFVQSYVNSFGKYCMSGWTAYGKIDQLVILPLFSIASASSTFVAQNLGKNDVVRARKGMRTASLLAAGIMALVMPFILIFAPQLVAFFNPEPAVIEYGTLILRTITPFYFLCCISEVWFSSLRGAGNTRASMLIMFASFVGVRQIYMFVMSNFIANEVIPIIMGYPVGWFVAVLIIAVYSRFVKFEKTRLVDDSAKPARA